MFLRKVKLGVRRVNRVGGATVKLLGELEETTSNLERLVTRRGT
jgi:hypothetical protein